MYEKGETKKIPCPEGQRITRLLFPGGKFLFALKGGKTKGASREEWGNRPYPGGAFKEKKRNFP